MWNLWRSIVSWRLVMRMWTSRNINKKTGRTGWGVIPLRFLEETVQLAHFIQTRFWPPFFVYNGLHFFTQWVYVMRHCCKVEKCMGKALPKYIEIRDEWKRKKKKHSTIVVVKIAPKLSTNIRCVRFCTDFSSSRAASMSQEIKSFWGWMSKWLLPEVSKNEHTGLSSQSCPYSSMCRWRSWIIGARCLIPCLTCTLRLVNREAAILVKY